MHLDGMNTDTSANNENAEKHKATNSNEGTDKEARLLEDPMYLGCIITTHVPMMRRML